MHHVAGTAVIRALFIKMLQLGLSALRHGALGSLGALGEREDFTVAGGC